MLRHHCFCLATAVSLLLGAGAAWSQTTFATITGVVVDSSGSAVPNASVTATNIETNVKSTTRSNETGNYTIAQLQDGTYSVVAQAAGFKEVVVDRIVLSARDVRRVDVKLEVGTVDTRVEVYGGATLIETETARIADTKDARTLASIPLNARALWPFLILSPGLQPQPDGVIRFAGSRVNQNNWAMDGTTFADGVDNTATGPLLNYIESFQEVKVDLANNSAEFASLGQVNAISKSGTNSLHGSVFDYYATPFFRARDPFAIARGTGISHFPGGSLGGPVVIPKIYNGRNRTFFFFSYETSRGSQVTQQLNPTVPLAAWRQGDFSALAVDIYDPQNNQPFPGKKIPANRINPVSQQLQDRFYPLPNFGNTSVLAAQNYREPKTRPFDPSTLWTGRLDQHFSDRDSVYARYTWQRNYNLPYDGNLPTIGRRFQERNNRAATVSYTHLFSTRMVNEIRWGYGFNNNPVVPAVNGPDIVASLGLVGLAPNLPNIAGLPHISFQGVALTGLTQPNYTNPGYRTHTEEIQEHFSWFRGRHNLKFGYNLLRSSYDDYSADPSLFGNVTFTTRFTSGGVAGQGQPYADFLLGIPSTAQRAFPSLPNARSRWSHDFYALDDFKLTSRITMNIGFRYELHLPWQEGANHLSTFDIGSGSIVVPDGALSQVSPLFPKNFVKVVEASSAGFAPKSLIHTRSHNIAPRLGVAWRPWDNKTVLRAGFGIFYDVVPFLYSLSFGGSPYILGEPAFTNPANNPQVIFPRVFPAASTGGPANVALPNAINPDLRTAYSLQYNFTIERQQWNTGFRISYVGTAMREGVYQYNYNSPVPNGQAFTAKARPFPQYSEIDYVTNGAGHQYNGLSVEAQRQMASGLYFQSSWTWARDRYDLDYNWDFGPNQYMPENPFDRHREIGPSQEIPKFRFTSNLVYQLPFGRGRHFMSQVSRPLNFAVGGWEMSGVYTTQTGQYLTPLWSGPDPVGIAFTTSSPAIVTIRPNILHNPNLTADQRALNKYFDTSAFTPPTAGQFGTSARGVVRGPGVNVWHMGLAKEFQFNDKGTRLRWEISAINVFNHPNWNNPGTTLSNAASFGVITATGLQNGSTGDRTGARQFRTGLRLQW